MTLKEMKELDIKKLEDRLAEVRDKVRELRFGLMNRQVKNVREIRDLRQEVARIMTVLAQKKNQPEAASKQA